MLYQKLGSTPAGQRLNQLMNITRLFKPNSAKTTFQGAVDKSGMYGAYGGKYGL